MNMSNEKLMRLAERALKRTESYQWNRGWTCRMRKTIKFNIYWLRAARTLQKMQLPMRPMEARS